MTLSPTTMSKSQRFAAQTLRHQAQPRPLRQVESFVSKNSVEDLLVDRVAERAQHDRDRQLAAAVDAREHAVLGIELEVEPGTAVGNPGPRTAACRSECVLPLSWSKNTPGRTVQLGDDDALGAVDDERAVLGHQRHFAEVDLLLAHVLDRLLAAAGFLVVDDQANRDAQRRGVGQPAQLALLDVEDGSPADS
jgi:hypothetical protein